MSSTTAIGISGTSRYGSPAGVRRNDASRRGGPRTGRSGREVAAGAFLASGASASAEAPSALRRHSVGFLLTRRRVAVGSRLAAAVGGRAAARGASPPTRRSMPSIRPPRPSPPLPAPQQFERVDAELLEELFQRFGVGRRLDRLLFVHFAEGEVEFDFGFFAAALRFDRQVGGDFADDVVFADVDVGVRLLDRAR